MKTSQNTWMPGAACLLLANTAVAELPVLSGCASQTPPFVLTEKGSGTSGYSVDLFRHVAKSLGRRVNIAELPWARCLNEVQKGHIDVAIDAYDDDQRRQKYHYSTPYYVLTPQIFYRKEGGPASLPVASVEGLKGLNGCGVREYTYEHYDLDAKDMDRGAANDIQMLKKLAAGRCDYALEELEYIIGGRRFVKGWPDESALTSFKPGWARGPKLHFLVSKQHRDAEQLHAGINAAIDSANKSGLLKRLRATYFQTLSSSATAKGSE